jgi:hypothetical protein
MDCHLRAYALLTCSGRGYLHQRAFLHVANKPFAYDNDAAAATTATTTVNGGEGGTISAMQRKAEEETATAFDPSVHVTNCYALLAGGPRSQNTTKYTTRHNIMEDELI